MQKITPHFWFDKEAKEAAEFYTSLLPDSKVTNITTLHDTPWTCEKLRSSHCAASFLANDRANAGHGSSN